MSSSLLLPNPCLLGIIFTIATHDGNHLVFHYPPKPNEYGFQATPLDINEVYSEVEGLMDSSDSDMDGENDGEMSDEEEEEDDDDDEDHDDDLDIYSSEDGSEDFTNSDITSAGNKSERSLSADSLAAGQIGHHRSSSSSGNKYQTGRDLLEMLHELEQKKRKKKQLKKRKKLKEKRKKQQMLKQEQELQSLKSSLKTPLSESAPNPSNPTKEYKVEKLFSFDIDFISDLATPPKPLCNSRFELTVEDMVFLGLPIHINEDGNWRVSKKSKRVRSKSVSTAHRSRKQSTVGSTFSAERQKERRSLEIHSEEVDLEDNHNTSLKDPKDLEISAYDGPEQEKEKDCGMYQFNMLFVMNPPVVEYNHRIDEMFHYIISRISLLLRYEQQKTNYVWNQSQKILNLKEELVHLPIRQQWKTLIEKSSLAKLIHDTYHAVIKSEIVNIEINGKINSFQIPIRKEFIQLPPTYLELPACSTLSSISPFNQAHHESETSLSQTNDVMAYFGLILLDDTELIIRDIKAEKDSVIASFIRLIKPNESLQRLSVLSGLDIHEVKMFANHLVYWRRAMAVLPLTSRNIYVVSPIAPIKNIYTDSTRFNQTFPNLPTLPTFLSMISDISSSKPKPISNIIPSRDHRDLYMDAVGWLFKNGYVIQLYTFLYLKISKDIKIRVAEEVEMEIKKKLELKAKHKLMSGLNNNESNEETPILEEDNTTEDFDLMRDASDGNMIELDAGGVDTTAAEALGRELANEDAAEERSGMDKMGSGPDARARRTDNSADTEKRQPEDTRCDIIGAKVLTASTYNQGGAVSTATDDHISRRRNIRGDNGLNTTDNIRNNNHDVRQKSKDMRRFSSMSGRQYPTDDDTNKNNQDNTLQSTSQTGSFYNLHGRHQKVQFEQEEEEDTILLEPEYCTSLERRWIAKVVESQPADIVSLFYRVLKYLNGRNAQEVFILQENISRHDMRKLYDAISESLVVVRHW